MDTRQKILAPAQALEAAQARRASGQRIKLVEGHFDPLLAAHARRLAEIAEPGAALFVTIVEPARPILPAQARAELVAALKSVDYVVLGGATSIPADEVYDDRTADSRLTEGFIEHVRQKNA